MKATIFIIELLSNADLGSGGHLLLRLGAILMLLGLPLSLGGIVWALRNAPEGYEDEEGFHSKQRRSSIRHSAGVAILRPHKAG
jgi:hypothetical protein